MQFLRYLDKGEGLDLPPEEWIVGEKVLLVMFPGWEWWEAPSQFREGNRCIFLSALIEEGKAENLACFHLTFSLRWFLEWSDIFRDNTVCYLLRLPGGLFGVSALVLLTRMPHWNYLCSEVGTTFLPHVSVFMSPDLETSHTFIYTSLSNKGFVILKLSYCFVSQLFQNLFMEKFPFSPSYFKQIGSLRGLS